MDRTKFSDFWILNDSYKFKVDPESILDEMLCSICKNLMSDACHSICGCQYCYKCITEYIGNSDKYCPGRKIKCEEEYLNVDRDVMKDVRMNNKIFKSRVFCPNNWCDFKIELAKMQEHLNLCTKQPVECPFTAIGCEKEIEVENGMLSHLHNDVFHHTELLMECTDNLKNEFTGIKSSFDMSSYEINCLKEESRMKDKQMKQQKKELVEQMAHQKNEILEQMVHQNKEMLNQMAQQKKEMMELKKEIVEQKRETNEVMTKLKNEMTSNKKEMESLNEIQIKKMKKEYERREREFEEQKRDSIDQITKLKNEMMEKVKEMEEGMKEIKRETDYQRRNIRLLMKAIIGTQFCNVDKEMKAKYKRIKNERRRMNDLGMTNELCPIIDEDFVWKIDEISKKIGESIYSDSFCSNNYKFCLRLDIVGDSVYLRCHIMRGDNDDKVLWPMRGQVLMSILNQDTMKTHKTEIYKYDTYKYNNTAFNRPKNDIEETAISSYSENYPFFILISFIQYSSIINNSSIIVNDSIVVSCMCVIDSIIIVSCVIDDE